MNESLREQGVKHEEEVEQVLQLHVLPQEHCVVDEVELLLHEMDICLSYVVLKKKEVYRKRYDLEHQRIENKNSIRSSFL